MKIIKESDVLESEAKTGKKKYWKCKIVTSDDVKHFLVKEYWQEGSIHQNSAPKECLPKNIGKSNETSSLQQAELELASKILKQKDKGYIIPGEEVEEKDPLPMLAHEYKKKKNKVIFSAYGQPKYDGMRAIYKKNQYFYSRGNKQLITEVTQHIKIDTQGYILDGELYIPGEFQLGIKAAKKYRKELSERLIYVVYDVIIENKTFEERLKILKTIFKQKGLKSVELSPVYDLADEKDIEFYHSKCVKDGFEGLMIRNKAGMYLIRHRSNDLLKRKDTETDEFEIVDVKEGEGSWKGAGTFVCKNKFSDDPDATFDAKPDGSIEQAREFFKNKKKYIGKMLTVRYQNLTDDKSVRFPVALTLRDYE